MRNDMLVLGAAGKTGRRVIERLALQNCQARSGSRSGAPPFDWEDRRTWAPVLQGIGRVYVAYYPDLGAPGAADTIGAFVDTAKAQGVHRVVLLSGRGETEAAKCERLVRESNLEWTVIRASWFAQNFSENMFLQGLLDGELALPVGEVQEPFVDVEDIAEIATAALLDDAHVGQLYEVTGPRLWSFAAAVKEIARVTGREIRYVPVSITDYVLALHAQGVPGDVISLLRYLFTEVLDGRNASVTDGVRRGLRREARDFSDYVRATADVWKTSSTITASTKG
jgi:uncharacterized protein YbjT (DUF2867 family)